MRSSPSTGGFRKPVIFSLIRVFVSGVALLGLAFPRARAEQEDGSAASSRYPSHCGADDHPETDAVAGPGAAALRRGQASGVQLQPSTIGKHRRMRPGRRPISADEHGNVCAYQARLSHGQSTHLGLPVIRHHRRARSDPDFLSDDLRCSPCESLKVNERRHCLASANGHTGGGGHRGLHHMTSL